MMWILVTWLPTVVASVGTSEYDHFTFAQSWPPGVCALAGEVHSCQVDRNITTWTIHGLWPTNGSHEGPYHCSEEPFDENQIASLKNELLIYWPNLFKDTEADRLWDHEWTKHGVCAKDVPATNGEYNYFSKGLELNRKYPLLQILEVAGITPNKTTYYTIGQVHDAVKNTTGVEAVFMCYCVRKRRMHPEKRYILTEIQICLDKTKFTPVACPNVQI
ncbi:ribonuclease Oy-like isoform X1 [Dreissena polymorpha]|uniref:Uncharacterized protein n=1 Tax=Dreissena polymorpha TaxID=45954 RepID=A0A9D4GZM3_DREPO|nr:ribonuclease Oy-like isoform X1 [Dreissena polymorpha]KAH3824381.1 hypothetical protein DPMN_126216 [Dreissena polymorpha]